MTISGTIELTGRPPAASRDELAQVLRAAGVSTRTHRGATRFAGDIESVLAAIGVLYRMHAAAEPCVAVHIEQAPAGAPRRRVGFATTHLPRNGGRPRWVGGER